MQLTLSIAIMLESESVAIMLVLSFYCSYVVRSFCSIYAGEISAANLWVAIFESLQCIMYMTISIVIMQVTASVEAMYLTVSSSNFIFLSLTGTHFSLNWPENIRRQKALYQVCISPL